jgi:hypothetical protein
VSLEKPWLISFDLPEYTRSLEDLYSWPTHSQITSYPNGSEVMVEESSDGFFPMYADGKDWSFYYPYADPTFIGHYESPVRVCFSTLGEAIDFITGELLKSYNNQPTRVWP